VPASPRPRRWNLCAAIGLILGCGASRAVAPESARAPIIDEPGYTRPDDASAPVQRAVDDARGGRLFDNWRAEKKLEDAFVPDAANTPPLDGRGGPNGNGTLNSGSGQPMPNTGHDYRLKNFFGWDLRGAAGIYGGEFQNKAYVLDHDLLTDTRSPAELRAWLVQGDARLPAFGQVLDEADMTDLVAYLVKTREGKLARPQNLFRLDAAVPKNYTLLLGGDAARGLERYASSCAACHGEDGTTLPIDETESVGTIARSSGYEVWFKMTNGQPGTVMERQVAEASGPEHEGAILDLFAALCDRKRFPPRAGASDVPDKDPRCGAYLE
jgi:mono/diheme cytochrome c family protein